MASSIHVRVAEVLLEAALERLDHRGGAALAVFAEVAAGELAAQRLAQLAVGRSATHFFHRGRSSLAPEKFFEVKVNASSWKALGSAGTEPRSTTHVR